MAWDGQAQFRQHLLEGLHGLLPRRIELLSSLDASAITTALLIASDVRCLFLIHTNLGELAVTLDMHVCTNRVDLIVDVLGSSPDARVHHRSLEDLEGPGCLIQVLLPNGSRSPTLGVLEARSDVVRGQRAKNGLFDPHSHVVQWQDGPDAGDVNEC